MRNTLIGLVLALVAAPNAPGDTVVLVDGTEVDGRILWRREGRIAVLLEDGTSRLIEEARVVQVIADAELEAELARRRGEADALGGAARAEAYLELGIWAGRRKALGEAADALLVDASRIDPEIQDMADYHRIRLAIDSGRTDDAAALTREALARNPNHEWIRGLVPAGEARAIEIATDRLAPLVEAYQKQRYDAVLVLGRQLAAEATPEEAAAMSKELENRIGVSLAAILVDARFRQTCRGARCENGMVKCPYCQGEGRVKRFRRAMGGDYGESRSNPVWTEWCGHCDGRIYYPCKDCKGTGLDLGEPTPIDREELLRTLLALVEENSGRFQKLVEEVREGGELKMRSIDSYSILSMGRHAIYCLEKAIEIHPPLGSPAGKNLLGRVREIRELSNTFLSGLSTSYMEEADRLYQESVDIEISAQNAHVSNIPSRVLKLQESLALAEESRKYIVELIESDPASKGFLEGNYQRRLELIDEFIERNRKALAVMRNVEAAPDRALDLLRRMQGEAGERSGGSR